jgi:hypothetical protein
MSEPMQTQSPCYFVEDISQNYPTAGDIDVFVVAAGFEERAFEFLSRAEFSDDAICVVSLFENEVQGNSEIEEKFLRKIEEKFHSENVHKVRLAFNEIFAYKASFREVVLSLPHAATRVFLDVSGFPAYAVCAVLDEFRECRPYESIDVLYTSAVEYTPTIDQYEELMGGDDFETEVLPPSMAKEMSENLTFTPFAGHLKGEGNSCLALFAGYEAHRSAGVIESINPSMLLIIYGDPCDDSLSWRMDLSKKLHAKFERTRKRAVETVPTQGISESIAILEEYYNFLIDDYDLIVSPICSKLQVIACYLFWEKFQEVQLTFPLPIGYDPKYSPTGASKTYRVSLPSRVRFKA